MHSTHPCIKCSIFLLKFGRDFSIDDPLVGTAYAGGVNVLATWVALVIMDRVGRKTLILWSCGGMFLSCVLVVAIPDLRQVNIQAPYKK